ncbi:hypothetical protein HALLA_00525 (plasmid) [Halostagnicola larsenii XH-48]|uniref:Uncharacterized protein n=1 Tax=Halostagnicola larsenii XH-48 TaxID=797299 RepID=W0JXS9_9EURY|nr:hypothetical protein [Halostagnicola larsenii]AHG01808.1 hypothetical protein HALLA_00525 [Halostagnicola larsenii XH-48]
MHGEEQSYPANDRWEAFVADAESIADEYREDDWSVLELHPGDVAPQPGPSDRPSIDDETNDYESEYRSIGFDVVVPDDEFEELKDRLGTGFTVSRYEVYQASGFSLIAELDDDQREAVFVPLYYAPDTVERLERLALERGRIDATVRPLSRRRVVSFSHDEPSLFFELPSDTAQSSSE